VTEVGRLFWLRYWLYSNLKWLGEGLSAVVEGFFTGIARRVCPECYRLDVRAAINEAYEDYVDTVCSAQCETWSCYDACIAKYF